MPSGDVLVAFWVAATARSCFGRRNDQHRDVAPMHRDHLAGLWHRHVAADHREVDGAGIQRLGAVLRTVLADHAEPDRRTLACEILRKRLDQLVVFALPRAHGDLQRDRLGLDVGDDDGDPGNRQDHANRNQQRMAEHAPHPSADGQRLGRGLCLCELVVVNVHGRARGPSITGGGTSIPEQL